MSILEITAKWSGFSGGPGYSTFHTTNAGIVTSAVDNSVTGVMTFFENIKAQLCTNTTIQVQAEVKELDPATGALVGLHTAATAGTKVGSGSPNQGPSPAGAVISWGTGGVNRGRRVRGRTFVVPMALQVFQADGSIDNAVVAALKSAATNYRTSSAYESLIWSRPRAGAGGAAFPILTSNVPDMVAVLRSRRD